MSSLISIPVISYPISWHSKDRPLSIQQRIDQSFTNYTLQAGCSYAFTGQDDYFTIFTGVPSAQEIVLKALLKKEKLEILDLGTGDGEFLKSLKEKYGSYVQVLGISAIDYRKVDKNTGWELEKPIAIPDKEYTIGNIENLDQIPSLKGRKFDLIVSSYTFMHLSDPLGSLCQSYEFLKPNGLLVIDSFNPQGLTINELSESFKKYKFQMIRDDILTTTSLNRFVLRIKKTTPHLELPIFYNLNSDPINSEKKDTISYIFSKNT